ncbi:MAG: hypothetical protein HY557_07875 [Euryarchaeota archaeon]|nr:hypothetical protein [Euryarchaeota archaeon]
MSNLATELGHLKHDVQYPANKKAVVAACNNMSDYPMEDRDWFMKNLPEGTYKGPDDVLKALLGKL